MGRGRGGARGCDLLYAVTELPMTEAEDRATKDTPPHFKPLEEIERTGIPGLVEALREEGTDDAGMSS